MKILPNRSYGRQAYERINASAVVGFDNPKAKEMVIVINDVVGVKELVF